MIPVGRLAPKDQWDQHILDLLFSNRLYPTGLDFTRVEGYPNTDGCVLVIPGRYWAEKANSISEAIAKYRWVLAVRAGDEEDLLKPDKVYHPNIRWWVQYPRTTTNYGDARLIGIGWPPHFDTVTPAERDVDVFLSAQNTHPRRNDCFDHLESVAGVVEPTGGFSQGMDRDTYRSWMCRTKVAPCPSGPASPDTFRFWEALHAHAVPVADDVTPGCRVAGFWTRMFPDAPFPIIIDYQDLPGYIDDALAGWPANANRITAWWMQQKRQYALNLIADLHDLGAL